VTESMGVAVPLSRKRVSFSRLSALCFCAADSRLFPLPSSAGLCLGPFPRLCEYQRRHPTAVAAIRPASTSLPPASARTLAGPTCVDHCDLSFAAGAFQLPLHPFHRYLAETWASLSSWRPARPVASALRALGPLEENIFFVWLLLHVRVRSVRSCDARVNLGLSPLLDTACRLLF